MYGQDDGGRRAHARPSPADGSPTRTCSPAPKGVGKATLARRLVAVPAVRSRAGRRARASNAAPARASRRARRPTSNASPSAASATRAARRTATTPRTARRASASARSAASSASRASTPLPRATAHLHRRYRRRAAARGGARAAQDARGAASLGAAPPARDRRRGAAADGALALPGGRAARRCRTPTSSRRCASARPRCRDRRGARHRVARALRPRGAAAHRPLAAHAARDARAADALRLASAGRNERFDYAAAVAARWSKERASVLGTLDAWSWWWRDRSTAKPVRGRGSERAHEPSATARRRRPCARSRPCTDREHCSRTRTRSSRWRS